MATTTTHLNFRGDARAALEFYHSVFGGDITLVTYADAHREQDAAAPDQVLWGQVAAGSGFRIMGYDVQADRPFDRGTNSFYVSVRSSSEEEITALWKGLSAEGTVVQDLGPSGWASLYGMVTDPFGVTWVLDVVAY